MAAPTLRGSEALQGAERLKALRALGVLDEPLDESFDRIARLAVRAVGAAAGFVTLVDGAEQHFVGRSEPGPRRSPNSHGFCPFVAASGEPLALEDVRGDREHAANPVAGDVGAYLGLPLRVAGQTVGTVCVVGPEPRSWTDGDRAILADAAGVVLGELGLRRAGSAARDHAEASERERRGLEQLNDLVAELSATVELQAMLEQVLRAVLELLEVSSGSMMLCDAPGEQLRLAAEIGLTTALGGPAERLAWGQGASGQAAATGRPARVPDFLADDIPAPLQEAARAGGWRSAYAAPLVTGDGQVLGTVAAYAVEAWSPTAEQAMLVGLFARTAAGLVAAARHAEEREDVLGMLQASLRPTALPETPGFGVAAAYLPFTGPDTAGGDFYDVLRGGEDELVLLLGDICGKGPRAAALTALARHSMRAAVLRGEGPRAILRATNTAVLRGTGPNLFATGVAALARRRENGELAVRVAAAGHPPPLLVRADGTVEAVACGGTALGILPEIEPLRREVVLAPGDALVLYTDGLTDLAHPDGTRLGDEGLAALVAAGAGGSAAEQVDALSALVQGPDLDQRDDMAMLVLGCPRP